MPKILISDELSPLAVNVFVQRGLQADQIIGLSPNELLEKILTAIEDVGSLYTQIKAKRSEYYEYNQ